MKQLLIDAGNTRLKWRVITSADAAAKPRMAASARVGRVHALPWSEATAARAARRVLRDGAGAARVLVCSVAGTALERALRQAARAAQLPRPLFIRSARRAAGVRNGYEDTWRLGADRWLAMIGARALLPARALCVVDIGTALTIDLLDEQGRHRGGLLVPGPALMVEALLRHTAGIRRRAGARAHVRHAGADTVFARSTRAGLQVGSELAAAALVERALREGTILLGRRPRLLLAGGGAARIAPRLEVPALRADDLVLRGLAVLATGHSG